MYVFEISIMNPILYHAFINFTFILDLFSGCKRAQYQRNITLLIISTPPYPFSIEFEFTPIIKANGFSVEELELHCKILTMLCYNIIKIKTYGNCQDTSERIVGNLFVNENHSF